MAAAAVPDALLRIDRLNKVSIEFTTRCNLRCSYCAITQPYHPERDLAIQDFSALVDELTRLGVTAVQISGAGETTVLKGWDQYLYRLVEAGFRVSIITNFAKPMTEWAARALSRTVEITTSCDTADPELFDAIRSRGDFRMFLHNILRVRAICIAEQRAIPRLIWNMVASDKVIHGVERWVALGIAAGIDHFQVSEMTKFPDVEGAACNVQPIGTLPLEELARARDAVEHARSIAVAAGKDFNVLPFVEEVLAGERKSVRLTFNYVPGPAGKPEIHGGKRWLERIDPAGAVSTEDVPEPEAAPARMTRNCILPWTEAFLWASNQVGPCCLMKSADFSGSGLIEAVNSPEFVAIRQGLLTGNPQLACRVCTMYPLVEPAVLQQRVAALPR